jgi:hypothetical protein
MRAPFGQSPGVIGRGAGNESGRAKPMTVIRTVHSVLADFSESNGMSPI